MIPEFNDHGYLPAGVHAATLEEVVERFGRGSELRRVQAESLGWLVELARRAGAHRLIVNGSFVTDVVEPNDVDCVLIIGAGFPQDPAAEVELRQGLPFVTLHVVGAEDFDLFVSTIFGTDRFGVSKGVVEVQL